MAQLFSNNAVSTLAAQIISSDTTLTLASGTGSKFPSPTGEDYFLLTLVGVSSGVETSWEIVKVTARSTDTLTIVRSQESTTAATWAIGTKAEARLTSNSLSPSSLGAYSASNPSGYTNNTGTVTSVTGTAPVVSSGGATPAISMAQATTGVNGYLSSADFTTFNNKANSGANTNITSVALTTGTVSASPSAATDIANKDYVDTVAQGLDPKASCVAATTANITLSAPQTIDGVALVAGNRCLVKNQTAQADNGIYVVAAGAWTRATDLDLWAEVPGAFTFIEQGTTLADTGWVCTSNAGGTLGTTAITFVQFAGVGEYTAGTGLTLTGTQFSITNTGTAGSYGSASSVPVIATNAQGQVTAVTNTAIAIAGSAVSGNITGNAANVTGTVAIVNGGTGATTRQDAMDALAGATTSGSYLRGNGADVVMSTIQAGDVPTLNQNTTGTSANVTGVVAVANGGTGLSSTPANGQLNIGNGTDFTRATLTAGTGISITNSSGSITIAATASGDNSLLWYFMG